MADDYESPYNFEVVEYHGLKFLKSDAEALEKVEKKQVVIDANDIGYQFTQTGDGRRWVERVIRKDPRTGKEFIIWDGLLLEVKEAGTVRDFEDWDEGLGYYRAIDQAGQTHIDGDIRVQNLPDAEALNDLKKKFRGPNDYAVVTVDPDSHNGRTLYSGLDGRQATEELQKARDRGQEAYIIHEDDIPDDEHARHYEAEDWRDLAQGGGEIFNVGDD